ncbi:MAG TPA: hypothetical protein VJ949_02250, partial [Cryomorphaceae bacterium]|nr:hypothetical protein [Cryomorphaceae bacterium]
MLSDFLKFHFLLILGTFVVVSGVTYGQSDLVLTAAYDGPLTGGTPKGVEIYVINDTPDLSIYGVGSANNGGGSDGVEFTFPAVGATAGDFIYIASESPQFNTFFGFAPDCINAVMFINGDDAIELFQNGSVVDVFGAINTDGTGEPWEYLDGWAYRNDNTGPDGNTFILGNWSFSGTNELEGGNTNTTTDSPIPIGTFQYATTCVLPSSAATNLNITGITSTSANLNWAIGDGEGRVVIVKQGSAIDATPSDNTSYLANSIFTLGEEIGSGNHVVYNGTENSFGLTGLTPGQVYYAEVFEYGCSPGQELYLTSTPASEVFLVEPTDP